MSGEDRDETLGRFTSGLPSARPTTEGEKHESERAQKADRYSNRRIGRRIAIFVTFTAIGLGVAYVAGHQASDRAPAVGDCAARASGDKIKKVSCDDDAAEFRVTSRVDDATDGNEACANDPKATSYYSYESGPDIVKFVLCLAAN